MKQLLTSVTLAAMLALPCTASKPTSQHQPSNRAKVTAIFISVTLPDGTVKNISLDPAETEALFFTDRAVTEMLGPFYEMHGQGKSLSAVQLLKRHGMQARSLLKGEPAMPLTRESLLTWWNTPNSEGVQPAFTMKAITCDPTEWP